MDILINNIELPKKCEDCPCSEGERDLVWCKLIIVPNECVVGGEMWKGLKPHELKGRPNWCPLVEVKPHGRLIDADEFSYALSQQLELIGKLSNKEDSLVYNTVRIIKKMLEDAPTVLEAST